MARHDLSTRIAADSAEIELVAEQLNESSGVSWLWALLFGPIYFAVHGFWGRAVLMFFLNIILIGFIVAPFIVYPAWRERAKEKAERRILLERTRSDR
jgi:hypothetical protein